VAWLVENYGPPEEAFAPACYQRRGDMAQLVGDADDAHRIFTGVRGK
jgi:hypothetical protein